MKQLRSKEWPVTHLLNPEFVYRHAANTDVAETFRKAKARIAQEKRDAEECEQKVRRLKP